MSDYAERRRYQRCDSTICKAMLSVDTCRWDCFEISDISAGGLSFMSSRCFNTDTRLFFNIYVYNMLSEFNLKFEGHILRQEIVKGIYRYAVKFDKIDKYTQVQLDELIKSRITLTNTEKPAFNDGIYTFLFIPRVRPRRMGLHIKIR